MWARVQTKGNPLALLVGMQTCAAALENSVEVPEKVKFDPAVVLLGSYPKDTKTQS